MARSKGMFGMFGDLGRVRIKWGSLSIVIPGALIAAIVWLILSAPKH